MKGQPCGQIGSSIGRWKNTRTATRQSGSTSANQTGRLRGPSNNTARVQIAIHGDFIQRSPKHELGIWRKRDGVVALPLHAVALSSHLNIKHIFEDHDRCAEENQPKPRSSYMNRNRSEIPRRVAILADIG